MPITINNTADLIAALSVPSTGFQEYAIEPGIYSLPHNIVLPAGSLNSKSFLGSGPNCVIECHGVLYLTESDAVWFENIAFTGAINSRNMRDLKFHHCSFTDSGDIGWEQKVLFKSTGAPYPQFKPTVKGAGPIKFTNCYFDQNPKSKDCMLDFVATQGVEITDSIINFCVRGVMQCKGGSGILDAFVFARNWVRNGGSRGVFFGGVANREFFDPPLAEAKADFGSGYIHDNVIEGGGCAFTMGTVAGPIKVNNNTCIGQSGHQMRLVSENQSPEAKEGIRNITIENNSFFDWVPPRWPNTNVLAVADPGTVQWDTVTLRSLRFNYPSRKQFWGFPDQYPIPSTDIIYEPSYSFTRNDDYFPVVESNLRDYACSLVTAPKAGTYIQVPPKPPLPPDQHGVEIYLVNSEWLTVDKQEAESSGKPYQPIRITVESVQGLGG